MKPAANYALNPICFLALPKMARDSGNLKARLMIYDVNELKREIRIALDQNKTSDQLLTSGDIDTLSMEEIIESKICDAARIIHTNAPSYLLDGGKAFGDSIGWKSRVGYGMGYIHLPEDFLRLVTFQMSDWSRAVTVAIDETDPLYEQQQSRYGGVRGNPQKPVVAITTQPIGQVLEFYSCTAGEHVYIKRARYIPMPHIENGGIELCEKLKSAVVYYTAYLVALSTGQSDLATSMSNIASELIK